MTTSNPRADLPPPRQPDAAPLMGRTAELEALAGLTSTGGTGLVTLVGPAGVGKTRVALEHLAREAASGSRRTLFVPLGSVREITMVRDEIVARLPGRRSLAAHSLGALWEKYEGDPLLLVLDDVEQLADVGALVEHLLNGYPELHVVTSGLRPLHLAGERVLRIRPLPAPGADAIAVFAQHATAVDASFRLTDEMLEDVASICRSVGGLPLAIELAAARVTSIPPAVLARQLADHTGIGLLRAARGTADDRHGSMDATLDWSYGLLTEHAQSLLTQLTVFEGTFSLEAAGAVVLPAAASSAEMLDRLCELVDLQLVDLVPDDPSSPRFSLSPLVRGYAARHLRASGAEGAVRSRHARHFQARCHSEHPLGRDELADTISALDRAILDGHVDDALHAVVASMRALVPYPGAARTVQSRLDTLIDRTADIPGDAGALARALVWSATRSGEPDDDTTYAEWMAGRVRAAVTTARRSGDARAVLSALELTIRSLPTTLDAASATAAVAEGLELSGRLGDRCATARFEMYAAMAARAAGDPDRSVRLVVRALEDAGDTPDLAATAAAVLLLHNTPARPPSTVPRLPSLEELLDLCERAGHQRIGYLVLAALATDAMTRDDLAAAVRYVHGGLVVSAEWRRTDPIASLIPLAQVASIAAARGDLDVAAPLVRAAQPFEAALAFTLAPAAFSQYRRAADLVGERSSSEGPPAESSADDRGLDRASERAFAYTRGLLAAGLRGGYGSPADPRDPAPTRSRGPALTTRERDVLVELAGGGTNKEIAGLLGLTPKTVMHHSMSIYRKLGVRSRSEATAWAFRNGLVGP